MGNNFFLFEFKSIHLAEQVMEGIWEWKKSPVKLIWWNPLVATVEERSTGKSTWVKILGLPLHLWSQKIFKAIGDLCGGWLETEEETTLRNHLKWARIRVCSDGNNIPREVKVENGGVIFEMQIWAELPARAYGGDRGASNLFTQKVVDQDPLDKGVWTDMGQLKGTRPLSHALPCDSVESSGVRNRANVDGLSMLDPKVILGLTPKVTEASKASFIKDAHAQHMTSLKGLEDIKVLAENFILALKNWEISSKATYERREEGPSVEDTSHTHAQLKNNNSHKQTQGESTNTPANQAESREVELQIQQIHQPEPVDINTYGVAFEGFESETLELLMRIDERKMEIDKTKQPKETTTPKSRGRRKNELKNLQTSLNKEVEGVKILTWNVRGLNNEASKSLVKTCLQKWKADVICLQETK
ncbi:hypothetical protein H5410_004686, partial [Solanum commersonii]